VKLTRRAFVRMAAATPLAAMRAPLGASLRTGRSLDRGVFVRAPSRLILPGGEPAGNHIRIERTWAGPVCRTQVVNSSGSSVRIKEIILFDVAHDLPDDTALRRRLSDS